MHALARDILRALDVHSFRQPGFALAAIDIGRAVVHAFNHPNYTAPNTTIGNVNYGKITGAQSSRVTEFAIRIFF